MVDLCVCRLASEHPAHLRVDPAAPLCPGRPTGVQRALPT